MLTKEQRLVIKKRRVELEALGIDPTLFYHANKLLNREVTFIIKNGEIWLFKQGAKSLPVDRSYLGELLVEVFSIKRDDAFPIIKEWERERKIYHYMVEKNTLHWDLIILPLPYKDNDKEPAPEEKFNF